MGWWMIRLLDLALMAFWLWLLFGIALGAEPIAVRIVDTDAGADQLIGVDDGASTRVYLERSRHCGGYPPVRIRFVDAYDGRAAIRVRLVDDPATADLVFCVR